MNILVTGANGFIGKHLCDYLGNQSHNVLKIVRKNAGDFENTFELELTDANAVQVFIDGMKDQKIDTIIHLAASLANVEQGYGEQIQVLLDNIEITRNVIKLVKALNLQKLINFSSMAVYPNTDGIFSEDSQIKMSQNTDCFYGLSKFCSENIIDHALMRQEVIISHLRIAQVYGEGMCNNRIIPIMKQELEDKNTITVFGEGKRKSNFIGVEKLMRFLNYFIVNDLEGIYNIGDESMSYFQLAKKIINEKGNRDSVIILKTAGIRSKFHLDTNKFEIIMREI